MSALPAAAVLSENMKPVKKYYAQAKQLERVDARICYLCRLHAAKEGMKLKQTEDDLKFVVALLDWQENNNPMKDVSAADRAAILYEFITKQFVNADQTDRNSPVIDDDLAKCFLSIALLLDVYSQFGPLDDQEQGRKKYCQWKAVEIRKAIREGRPHMRGGFGDEPDEQVGDSIPIGGSTPSGDVNTPAPATPAVAAKTTPVVANSSLPTYDEVFNQQAPYEWKGRSGTSAASTTQSSSSSSSAHAANKQPQQPAPQQQPQQQQHQPHHQARTPVTSNTTSSTSSASTFEITGDVMTIHGRAGPRSAAMAAVDKLCKHAVSAVNFDDPATALNKLQEAIALLLPHRNTSAPF